MALSNVRTAADGRPFFPVDTCFRFGGRRHSGLSLVPGDFFDLTPLRRAQVLDESLMTWADDEGYLVERCSWELLTELPEEVAEAEMPGWGESYEGLGSYGWRG